MPDQIAGRADRLIARLRRLDGNVALFSHGEFSLALASRWIGLPVLDGQSFLLGTTSLGVLGYNPAHRETSVIAQWNVSPALLARGVRRRRLHDRNAHRRRVVTV